MKNCKRIFLAGAFSLVFLSLNHQVLAAARSNDAMDYLYPNPSLGRITAGLYGGQVERELALANSPLKTIITSTRFYGYLGYDLAPWLNVYGIFGVNEAELTGTPAADAETLFGAGLSFNLLNRFIREPVPMEDAFRINGDFRIISTEATFFPDTVSWQEITASLRFGLINFPDGNKHYNPEAISLYVGPAYSYIHSDEVESTQELGVLGGIEFFLNDALSVDLSVEQYDQTSFFGGINFRF